MKRGFFKMEEIAECLYVDDNNPREGRNWPCRGETGQLLEWSTWGAKSKQIQCSGRELASESSSHTHTHTPRNRTWTQVQLSRCNGGRLQEFSSDCLHCPSRTGSQATSCVRGWGKRCWRVGRFTMSPRRRRMNEWPTEMFVWLFVTVVG